MLREALLMTILTLLLLAVGYAIGLYLGSPEITTLYALFIAAAVNMLTYLYSDRIVLSMTGAKLVSPNEAPSLHAIVDKVAKMAGIPKPKVAIVSSSAPNAFATGRNPSNAVVAVTHGLTRLLNDEELEAVISHEIAHIKHKDTLIAAMAATIAGAISYLAFIGRLSFWFGGMEENRNAGFLALLASILAPLAALMIQAAISREREYKADEDGAKIIKKPLALASALEKIEKYVSRSVAPRVNPATSPLWIVNPFRGDVFLELFSTHPPTWKRIKRLKELSLSLSMLT
ncbi:MAG: protease [Candidatus Methanomethylicota archaeon]|nr:MAG: protease [Candidatus Verstraetearchaeota archaeon]